MTLVYTVNAFSSEPTGGNPAGVVLNALGLSEEQMLGIAKAVGYSETAFVFPSASADWQVRFFTPVEEVDLCGHATIATFHVLTTIGDIPPGIYTQQTQAGLLAVEVGINQAILMTQNPPCFGEVIPSARIAESLNTTIDDLLTDLPCQIISTGLPDIIVPIKDLQTLQRIQPDFDAVSAISAEFDVTGYHLFCLETLDNLTDKKHTAHCRNLAPRVGIDEEAATGTASGALACYLFQHHLLEGEPSKISFEQGHCMNRPSLITVQLSILADQVQTVRVGGTANITGSLTIAL